MQIDKTETDQKNKQKKKRRKRIKRIFLVCLLVLVTGLGVISYGPVRTMASLERVDDYPLLSCDITGHISSTCLWNTGSIGLSLRNFIRP